MNSIYPKKIKFGEKHKLKGQNTLIPFLEITTHTHALTLTPDISNQAHTNQF